MMMEGTIGPAGTFLGGSIMQRGSLILGSTINMIKSGGFSQTSHTVQTMESIGWMALRRHRGKFGGQQPPLKMDREWTTP